MKKSLTVLLSVVMVLVMLTGCGGTKEAEIKIGFIGPMTGDNANYGILCNNSVKMAFDEYNAKGGLNGEIAVNLYTEDSEGSVEKGLSAIEQLSSSNKIVGLVGPIFTGITFAVGERCQAEGLPMITPTATHADITNMGDCVFRTVVSDGLQGEVAGTYFYDELGYRNLAVLYAKNDYSQGLYEGMTATFEKKGGKVVIAETCQVGDKDFKTQLTKIKAANPDAIYIPNYTVEMAQMLEQAAQLGIDIPFLSCDGFTNPDIYKLAGDYTDGVIYVGPTQVEESQAYKDYVAKYEKTFGVLPDSFATNAYDAANIMLDAVERAYEKDGKVTRENLRQAIEDTKDFAGVTGTVNFAPNGDLVAYQGIYRVEGQTPVYLGAYTVENGNLVKVD